MIFWFFIILFAILMVASLVLSDAVLFCHKTKFVVLAAIFAILLAGTIALSFKPVKMNEYTVKLSDKLVYEEDKPYKSMDVYIHESRHSDYAYLNFSSYSKKGYLPEDKVRIRNADVPIHFKKGTKNRIHYKKEVNIFGDESKYADNIVIEYNAENVKKAKEEKKKDTSNTSKEDDEKQNASESWRDWKDAE